MGNLLTMAGENRSLRDSMFLTQEEIDALCDGVKQPAAQFRKLEAMGLRVWMSAGRRKRVQIARGAYEAWKDPPPPPAPPEPHWITQIPPRPLWEDTPLGRWQQRQREAQAEYDAANPPPAPLTKMELAANEAARRARAKEERRALVRHHAAKRRTVKLQRLPEWADLDAIKAVYVEARRLTRETGIPHHVDHEIPLQGKLVSGLHVHNNLQILTGSENSKKHNRFEVEHE